MCRSARMVVVLVGLAVVPWVARSASAGACDAEFAAAWWVDPAVVDQIDLPLSDPYEGSVTLDDLDWLRTHRDLTGHWLGEGEYDRLVALLDCVNGRPSPTPVPTRTPNPVPSPTRTPSAPRTSPLDAECADLAEEWLPRILGNLFEPSAVPALTGCWEDDSGSWFFPTGRNDPRFVDGPIVTGREWSGTERVRQAITDQLAAFEGTLPDWMRASLANLEAEVTTDTGRPLPGPGLREAQRLSPDGSAAGQYGDRLYSSLGNPNAVDLAAFVSWWFNRRVAAVPYDAIFGPNPTMNQIVVTNLQLDRMPFPWEIRDEVALALFIRWAIDLGYIVVS
jgi:hypothetical protein